jgi:two-component system cell cycle response regulator
VRATDIAARLGGEEFVLVMTETDMNTAQTVTARLCRDIEASPFAGSIIQNGLPITGSIGVAVADNRDETAEDLVKRADEALYEAKRGGRNQVVAAAAVA